MPIRTLPTEHEARVARRAAALRERIEAAGQTMAAVAREAGAETRGEVVYASHVIAGRATSAVRLSELESAFARLTAEPSAP